VIPANIQDRDCAANLIRKTRRLFPWIAKIFADGGYAGAKLKAALAGQPVELEIVKRTDNEGGFKVVRRRWVIERTLSWLRRNRRLMAHYEAFAFIAEGKARNDMCHAQAAYRAKVHVRHVKFRVRLSDNRDHLNRMLVPDRSQEQRCE
jgi:transposase